jgi:transglutaminase-like putative cysteine protease
MSAGAAGPTGPLTINVAPRFERTEIRRSVRHSALVARLIRIFSFAALGGYGVIRWATLLSPAPTGRLLGLLALAVGIVVTVPLLRRLGPPPAIAAAVLLSLLALPVAGLHWHDFLHLRIAVGARAVGDGLSGLPGSFVPFAGLSQNIRTVIVLGAAVLLLDGAIVLAFAPTRLADARRAGAALPLIALVVVPSTLLRPELPYLQGFILFVLLVLFVWGERAHWQGRRAAVLLLGVAGFLGAVIAPRLDTHHAWLDYRSWTGNLSHPRLDRFAWNQNYGPLHWPRSGHVVLTVKAKRADYWKAEDLDVFNGYGWISAPVSGAVPPPAPSAAALAKWSEPIQVSITGMTSTAVIAAGYAGPPTVPGGAAPGQAGAGTWVSYEPLRPGSSYTVETYSPHPSAGSLAHAHGGYPNDALAAYRTLTIPERGAPSVAYPRITFAPFRAGHKPAVQEGGADITRVLEASPYGPVFALARQLAADVRTPYAYAAAISRYLNGHFAYNENPPARPYPLVSFLFADKIGYCQQFSGAMALLLRMGGVPARVAAGFTSGARDARGRFEVTDIDAHAWDEVWFPRYGWVRFDPTPAVAPARGGNSPAPFVKNLPGASAARSGVVRRGAQSTTGSSTHGGGHRAGTTSPWLLLPAAVVILLIGLLAASLAHPEPGPEEQLRELERALARTGRPLGPEVTLAALEQRFHDSASAAAYIRSLRLARYGASAPPPVPDGRRALREQLRDGLGATGRVRALWALPPRPRLRGRRLTDAPAEAPGGHLRRR